MLTKVEIEAADPVLDDIDAQQWVSLIQANQYYRDNIILFPDVQTVIEDASGTVKGQMLNALADKIEELGIGEVAIKNGDEGLQYSQPAERNALVNYALYILFTVANVVYPTFTGSFGEYQVRQRGICTCGSSYSHAVFCRMSSIY